MAHGCGFYVLPRNTELEQWNTYFLVRILRSKNHRMRFYEVCPSKLPSWNPVIFQCDLSAALSRGINPLVIVRFDDDRKGPWKIDSLRRNFLYANEFTSTVAQRGGVYEYSTIQIDPPPGTWHFSVKPLVTLAI